MAYSVEQFANFASSTVAGGNGGSGTTLQSTDTTLLLATGDGAKFPATTNGFFMLLLGSSTGTHEIVKCTARSGDTLTIVRANNLPAPDNGTASSWAVGSAVTEIGSAGSLTAIWNRLAGSGSPVYNVMDYGATGNGTTDDTAAIQAAINASSGPATIFFPQPASNYQITASLIVNRDDVMLLGYGERGAVNIQVASTADPAYALIIGNTAVAHRCAVVGLGFQGRGNGTSTGGGIKLNAIGSSIRQTTVAQFGGHGIYLPPNGTVYEVFIEDVQLIENGRNTTTPGDNLHNDGATDSEFIRIVSQGDPSFSTTAYGFYDNGGANKYVNCHAYFCKSAGIIAGQGSLLIVNCEWETNTVNVYLSGPSSAAIEGCTFFINPSSLASNTHDLQISGCSMIHVANCHFNSTTSGASVYITSSNDVTIANCSFYGYPSRSATTLSLDGNCVNCDIHDNSFWAATTAISPGGTRCKFHDNVIHQGNIAEGGSASGSIYTHNLMLSGQPITWTSAQTILRDNQGINPLMNLPVPAAPSLATATTGGTVLAGTYQAKVTYVNAYGETVASASSSITTTGSTSTITITAPTSRTLLGNATGWYAYVTQAGGATYTRQQAAGSPTALGTNLVLTAPPTSSGANPPASDTTNPISAPAVPASGVAYQNATGVDAHVYVSGGTVSAIAVGGQTTGLTSGMFFVPAISTITLTYSVAPSWVWVGN